MQERRYKPNGDDVYQAVGEAIGRVLEELKTFARARPLESLAAAFALGLLLVLFGRRKE